MERLASISGMKLKHMAYKGSAPALLALMGGEINLACTSAMSATAAIRSGKVRGVAALGVSDGMHSPQMVQRLAADGSEPAERMTSGQLKASLAREYVEVERQVKELGLKF